jgi:hypothetical protein
MAASFRKTGETEAGVQGYRIKIRQLIYKQNVFLTTQIKHILFLNIKIQARTNI